MSRQTDTENQDDRCGQTRNKDIAFHSKWCLVYDHPLHDAYIAGFFFRETPTFMVACSETVLKGETRFHYDFVHPWDANCWLPWWEANDWPTGLVRLCIGMKLQGLHKPPLPSNLTGALTGHCVTRKRRTWKEWNGTGGRHVWSQLAFHIISVKPC